MKEYRVALPDYDLWLLSGNPLDEADPEEQEENDRLKAEYEDFMDSLREDY